MVFEVVDVITFRRKGSCLLHAPKGWGMEEAVHLPKTIFNFLL